MTPKAIVNAMEARLGITGAPSDLRDAIERTLLDNGRSAATAAELTDRVRQKVVEEIERRHEEKLETGEIAILSLHRGGGTIHGTSHVFSTDSPEIRQSKLNRIRVNDIHDHIRGLDFSQFEKFGSRVLRELGCKVTRVTQHAGDQGIDFYGKLSVGSLLNADPAILRLMHETQVVVVGQTKHYPESSIGPGTVRELVGAMSLSRTRTFSKDGIDLLDEVDIRPFSPVLAMLFSTGDFTRGARHLAKRAGLIVFSGWQLSVFLADKGVGIIASDAGSCFSPTAFGDWLSSST
jgi:Restriction endonuclease